MNNLYQYKWSNGIQFVSGWNPEIMEIHLHWCIVGKVPNPVSCSTYNEIPTCLGIWKFKHIFCKCKNRQDQHKQGDIWICGDCENQIKQKTNQ